MKIEMNGIVAEGEPEELARFAKGIGDSWDRTPAARLHRRKNKADMDIAPSIKKRISKRKTRLSTQCIDAIAEHGNIDYRQVARVTGRKPCSCSTTLSALVKQGELERERDPTRPNNVYVYSLKSYKPARIIENISKGTNEVIIK